MTTKINLYVGSALPRRRGHWLRTLGYWAGAWWTLVAVVLWSLAVWVGSL